VNQTRGAETRASSRSYAAILDIAELSADDNGLEHVLMVDNGLGVTNYTFRLEVLGKVYLYLIIFFLDQEN
jgi:hypothetical protein